MMGKLVSFRQCSTPESRRYLAWPKVPMFLEIIYGRTTATEANNSVLLLPPPQRLLHDVHRPRRVQRERM